MGHNILMFGPPKDRLVSGGGIRPYYLSKELGQLGVKMSEIWGWQTKSLSSDQIKNKMKLLKHSIKSGDGAHYLVETAKSEKFMKTLAKTKIPIILDFYDDNGESTSSLKADYCYYTKKEDMYKATGNVVIQDIETNDRLDTEELFWSLKKEEVFTEKFVRIEKDGELLVGHGLEAKQDFSYYKILDSKGTISLSE